MFIYFNNDYRIYVSYIVAIVGNTRPELNVLSPMQKSYRVNQIILVEDSSAQLLHLEKPIEYSRYVQQIPLLLR